MGVLKGNNLKNFSNMDDPIKKPFGVVFKNYKGKKMQKIEQIDEEAINRSAEKEKDLIVENSKTEEEKELDRAVELERDLADVNNILVNKDQRLEEINMLEARNIAAHSELVDVRNDIHKNKNSNVIYTGENLDYLMETEKLNNNKEDTENDEILRIPYFSKSRTKVIKQTVKVKKTIQEEDELDENKTEKEIEEEENIVSQSHKTRVKLNLHELRNQPAKNNLFKNKGTEPDPDIFDINKIFALEIVLQKKNEDVDLMEQELKSKGIMIAELESYISKQKADIKLARENLEKALTKLAEFKLSEATFNFEDNNSRKIIMNLQKELGKMELKFEKKEEELDEFKIKEKNLSFALKELQVKTDFLSDENIVLKKEVNFLKVDNQRRIDSYSESERKNSDKIDKLETVIDKQKRSSTIEIHTQESYISNLQQKFSLVVQENTVLQEEVSKLEHRVQMMNIENDKSIITSPRKDSNVSKDLLPLTKSPRLRENSEEVATQNEKEKKTEIATQKQKPEVVTQESGNKIPRLRLNSNEMSKFNFTRIPTETKETQTQIIKKVDDEVQTQNFETNTNHPQSNLPHFLQQVQEKPHIGFNKNTALEEILSKSKPQVITSPVNTIQDLIQPSPINNYVYPTKITESLKKKTKNQVFFPETKKKNLEIKINQSLESNFINASEKIPHSNTDRFEIQMKSTQNKVEHERHMSFTEKAINKILTRQEAAKSLYFENQKGVENHKDIKASHMEKQSSVDNRSFIKKTEELFGEDLPIEEKKPAKSIFEMNAEEKELKINQMFSKFRIKVEENRNNSSQNKKILKKLPKKINKEEFEEEKLKSFSDFREFFLKFVEIHRKCGKDCSHLKLFYEKIGWTEDKITAFRHEIKPFKTVINSLPRIKN